MQPDFTLNILPELPPGASSTSDAQRERMKR